MSQSKEWSIGPMVPCTFEFCYSRRWTHGPSLRFKFKNEDGVELNDGMWWKDDMTEEYFEDIVQRTRHIVNTIAGDDGWAKAGSPKDGGIEAFFGRLAAICNQYKGDKFYLKTLYKLGEGGTKRVRIGKDVSFICRQDSGKNLFYSDDERDDTRLKLI